MRDSLKEERLKILELLEQGKITSKDAAELLGALKVGAPEEHRTIDVEEKFSKFCKSLDCFAKDVTDKVSEIYKDVEPKFKEVTKKTIEKTITVVDDLSKTLNDNLKSMEEEAEKEKCCCDDECCDEDDCCDDSDCCNEGEVVDIDETEVTEPTEHDSDTEKK